MAFGKGSLIAGQNFKRVYLFNTAVPLLGSTLKLTDIGRGDRDGEHM